MRRTFALVVLSAGIVIMSPRGAATQTASEAPEPFRVIGNIYYVGAQYGSYLITTPEGHILHDTGSADMHELIVSNVEQLGFDVEDIRIMISSHAHWDHVEGHAAMKRATRSGPRNLDSGLSEIPIVFQAAVPKLVASKYTTSGVRRPSEL